MATIAREVPPPLLSAAGGHVNGAMAAEEGRRPAAVPQAGAIAATESATAHNLGVSFRLYRETVPASSLLPSSPLMSAGVPLVAAMNNNLENHGHGGKVMAAAVLGNKATGGAVLRDKSNLPQISRTNAPGKPLLSLGGVVPTAIGRPSVPDDLGKTGTVGRPRGTSQATSASSQPQLKSFFSRMIVTNKARQELAAVERGRRAADVAGDAVKNTAAETEAGAADKLSSGGIALPVTTAPSFVPNLNQLPLLEDVPTYKLNSVHDAFLSPGEQPLVPLQDAELFSARDDEFGVLQPPRTCLSQFDNGLEDWDDGFARFDVDRVADVDADYANNHLYCVEYVAEIFEHLLELEVKRRPAPNYLMKQREITAEMRAILIDWIIEFAEDFKLVPETVHLCVNYIDRFLSRKNVPKHRLQLMGVAAIFIASKYEEINPCSLDELMEFCDHVFPAPDIIAMEGCILDTLKFDLNVATRHVFITRFQQIAYHVCEEDERLPHLINFLAELSLLEYPLLEFNNSQVAMSAVVLALHSLRHPHWNATLEFYSDYSMADLQPCLEHMHRMFCNAASSKLQVVWKKYARNDYLRVAAIRPRSQPPPCMG